ncbi:uncharacterized protein [Antedon mediterranea]|uniref:uncharacterized protein n=1 Tax=Antedon mediterranea TaxID=105859 RepID=UPI003AF6C889
MEKHTDSVFKIKSATEEDDGRYTCKAESDQFKGDDAKTSAGKQLNVYYIIVTFKPDIGFATCIAEGYPKPPSVLILQHDEVVKKGEHTVTIRTNDNMCQTSLTCYAENEKCNNTVTLEDCNPGSSCAISTIITAILAFILGSVPTFLTTRYIFVRRIQEIVSKGQNPHYQALEFPSNSGANKDINKDPTLDIGLTRTANKMRSRKPTRIQVNNISMFQI